MKDTRQAYLDNLLRIDKIMNKGGNPNHDKLGRFSTGSLNAISDAKKYKTKTAYINSHKQLTHYTNSKPMISNKTDRLIPNSISLIDNKGGSAGVFGSKKHEYRLDKNTKILTIDNKNFFKYGREIDTPLNRGKEIYKYATTKGYNGILIKNEVHGLGNEYAIFNMKSLKTDTELAKTWDKAQK
jgi:hypothetical protein